MNDMLGMILDNASRIFETQCTSETVERADAGQWPSALWDEVDGAGLTMALVPEGQGGAGLTVADALAMVRLAGYFAAPIPLGETLIAAQMLAAAGLSIPKGPLTIAAGTAEQPAATASTPGFHELSGAWERVPWASQCSAVVGLVSSTEGLRLACLRPDQIRIERGANLANEPRDTLRLDGVAKPAHELVDCPCDREELLAFGALLRSQQIAGAAERALDMAAGYAGERRQFGRPIAKFQAIQQQLAGMAGEVAAATAAADAAAAAWNSDKAQFLVATAKARSSEAAGAIAAVAHQVHGAMGFTREYPLHHFTRRLWSWRDEFGGQVYWQERLGDQVLALGAEGVWPYMTARPLAR